MVSSLYAIIIDVLLLKKKGIRITLQLVLHIVSV